MRANEKIRNLKIRFPMNRKGLQFRLYKIFVLFSVLIALTIGIVQTVGVYRQARQDTLDSLERTARNISATYGTSAYKNAISSVIYQGEYRVRTIQETGEILVDTSDLSFYLSWPDISLDSSEVIARLEQSDGTFSLRRQDSSDVTWVVYGQVLANWNGVREILLITKTTQEEILRVKQQLLTLFIVTAAILAISFLLSWYLAKSYLKPILDITACAKELAYEHYDTEFPTSQYTEIATLSDTLKLAADAMENYEKNRRDMIANVSHDMRTPLTMIKAYAEMIKTISGNDPEKRERHLDVIISEADRLSEFVNQTLTLSRLQSRTQELNKSRFSMSELLGAMHSNLQAVDQGQHEIRLQADADTFVFADVIFVEQMIQNLVNNSLKYGGDIIELKATRLPETVRLEIIDYGEGIPKEKLPYIWTKYYRVKANERNSSNAGVGLSIVKEIAEIHGIDYGVDSDVDIGARFWFDFPYAGEETGI